MVAGDLRTFEGDLARAPQRPVVERFVKQSTVAANRAKPVRRQPIERSCEELANPADAVSTAALCVAKPGGQKRFRVRPGDRLQGLAVVAGERLTEPVR